MNQKFTKNHLVKYIYNETNANESLAIEESLNEDLNLADSYNELLEGYNQLPKAKFNPSDSSIQKILAYSERNAVETHFK